jgi:hypothetical protein
LLTAGWEVVVMARGNVRTHTRRTADGKVTTVHQHSRRGRPRGALVSPGHAWKLARGAFRAARRKRRGTAFMLGSLALGELGAWLTLRGLFFMLATLGVLALGAATLAASASGGEDGKGGRGGSARSTPQRRQPAKPAKPARPKAPQSPGGGRS